MLRCAHPGSLNNVVCKEIVVVVFLKLLTVVVLCIVYYSKSQVYITIRLLKTHCYHCNSVNLNVENDITKWRPKKLSVFQEPECLFPKYVKQLYKMNLPKTETKLCFT